MSSCPSVECTNVTVAVPGRKLVRALTLKVHPGSFVGVLGPNGVGKTLTLETLAGLRAGYAEQIQICGDRLSTLPRAEVARRLGMVTQHQADAFPVTVMEAALLGCYARLGAWQWEGPEDRSQAHQALADMDLEGLDQRHATSLSGGERRRLAVATLLVQDPQVLLLDEPMNHLDPRHRFLVLDKLARLANAGRTVITSLHDPSLAARYTTHVLMLSGDGQWQFGRTDQLLTGEKLEQLYGTPFELLSNGEHSAWLPSNPRPPTGVERSPPP